MTVNSKIKSIPNDSARDRIISAAEVLFARKGLHGAGLRELAREAGVSVNMIGYYFADKDDLYQQTYKLKASKINEMRSSLLDDLDQKFSPGCPPASNILEAFINPLFLFKERDPEGWKNHLHAYMREIGTDNWYKLNRDSLEPAINRFAAALHRALPAASREDVIFVLMMAAQISAMAAFIDSPDNSASSEMRGNSTKRLEKRVLQAVVAAAMDIGEASSGY